MDELEHREDASKWDPVSAQRQVRCHKKTTATDATEADEDRTPDLLLSSWQPSILHVGPLSGLLALILAILQLVASWLILSISNGQAIAAWKYQPSVYLAILSAISNKALAFAAVQGTVVTFWRNALQGTTIGQLHRDWAYGFHVYQAILSGRHCSLLAIACVCATFVAIDGPLLQRASQFSTAHRHTPVQLSLAVAPELPSYATGITVQRHTDFTGPSPSFDAVAEAYASGSPIELLHSGCEEGICSTNVRGPALKEKSCTSELYYTNFSTPLTVSENTGFQRTHDFPHGHMTFGITAKPHLGARETIMLETVVLQSPKNGSCAAYVNTTKCYLESAIAEYAVQISDNTVTFAAPHSYPNIVADANNTELTDATIAKYHLKSKTNEDFVHTTLSGIAYVTIVRFQSATFMVTFPNTTQPQTINGQTAWFAWQQGANSAAQPGDCLPSIADPREVLMSNLNELMFRAGVHYAQLYDSEKLKPLLDEGLEVNQTVRGTAEQYVPVFQTNFQYFAAAAAVELFTVLVILVTFCGWWKLGRPVSLSPLEVAKAFDAAALRDVGSNRKGRAIADQLGERKIQYGILEDELEHTVTTSYRPAEKLSFADPGLVHRPTARHLDWAGYTSSLLSCVLRRGRHPTGHDTSAESVASVEQISNPEKDES